MTDEAPMTHRSSTAIQTAALRPELKREGQLLKGDGTGSSLNGIMTQATVFDPT